MFLSVVMPAYNEEAAIESVVLDHVRLLEKLGSRIEKWEIVVVDDASRDRTPAILADLKRRVPQLRVVRNEPNRGLVGSFMRCFEEAAGTHIYYTASDGQWPPENIELLLDRFEAGADLVVGVRNNRHEVYSLGRRVISYCFNQLPSILFGVDLQDAGSVKLGITEVFRFQLISTSPFYEAERLIQAVRKGYRTEFVPIHFGSRTGGKATGSSWKHVYNSLLDMARCVPQYGLRGTPPLVRAREHGSAGL